MDAPGVFVRIVTDGAGTQVPEVGSNLGAALIIWTVPVTVSAVEPLIGLTVDDNVPLAVDERSCVLPAGCVAVTLNLCVDPVANEGLAGVTEIDAIAGGGRPRRSKCQYADPDQKRD